MGRRLTHRSLRRTILATAAAAVLSGAPSTAHAVLTGADPLAATRAAGTLVPGSRPGILRGALAHAEVSIVWGPCSPSPSRGGAPWRGVRPPDC